MRNIQLQSDTMYTALYADEEQTVVIATLQRQPFYDEMAWKAYDAQGKFIRDFRRTRFLVNWLIHIKGARIDHRPIDAEIALMVEHAKTI